MNYSALVTLILYAALLLGIGAWASSRARTQEAFLLGDRELGPWVAGLAYSASTSSAWVLLGFSGYVYAVGPSALWMIPGILAGYGVAWFWAGSFLQRTSREKGHLTLTDFLSEHASPGYARAIRICASSLIAFCFAFYIAGQFQGAGLSIDGLFNSGFTNGVLLGAVVIVAYTFLGGFLAVSLTDTIQGILIALVAIALPFMAFLEAGGIGGITDMLASQPAPYNDAFGGRTGAVALGFIVGISATGFGTLGQPHLLSWIMAARDNATRIKGGCISLVWGLIVYSGMAVLGLSARAIFGAQVPSEGVFLALSNELMPPVIAGIVMAAILSAIMSTVDSQLLVSGAALSHDMKLGKAFGGRDVLVSRIAIVAVSVVAIVLTFAIPSSIFQRILFAWTALGASFGPVVVARVLNRSVSGPEALAAILTGFSLSMLFEFLVPEGPGDIWGNILPWIGGFLAMAAAAAITRPRTL